MAERDETSLLKELLALGMPMDAAEAGTGETLLSRAAYHGGQATIEMLVKAGANLEHITVRYKSLKASID